MPRSVFDAVSLSAFICFLAQMTSSTKFWKGSLTGKAVVLKTTARSACGFESCPFRQTHGPVAQWE